MNNHDAIARQRWTILALLTLATLAVYWPVTHYGFVVYDDPEYVKLNPVVQRGLSLAGLVWAFSGAHVSNWHPLTWLSHMLDCQLFGLNAGAHHFVNLLLHLANTLLLYHVLARMTGAPGPSAFVAAMFAWHPQHVESVAWIAERKDVLCACFWMLTLLAYLRYVERPRAARYALALLLFALALLSKPMAVTLPGVLLLLDWWPLRRVQGSWAVRETAMGTSALGGFEKKSIASLFIEKLPFLLLAFAACFITYLAQSAGNAVSTHPKFTLGFRVANALAGYWDYLGKTICPLKLGVFYPLPEAHPAWKVLAALALMLGVSALALGWAKTKPWLLAGWLWFLGTLVPVIGLVQVGDQARADRYTYIPLIGLGMAAAWSAAALAERHSAFRKPLNIAGALMLALWIVLTGIQVSFWKDTQSLFTRALAVTGHNFVAETVLGNINAAAGKLEDAKQLFLSALAARPTYHEAHFGLGNVYAVEGKLDQAMSLYQQAARLNPNLIDAYNAMGVVLIRQYRAQEALQQFEQAISVEPAFVEAQFNRAVTLELLGHTREALAGFAQVLRLQPQSVEARSRSAWILSTHPDATVRNGSEAVRLAVQACALTGYQNAGCLNSLAAARAESLQFSEANQAAQKAFELATASGQKANAEISRKPLQSFAAGTPYRSSTN